MADYTLTTRDGFQVGRFSAMASPCEVVVDTDSIATARHAVSIAQEEAQRIEKKFSRYRDDNMVYQINNSEGKPVHVCAEISHLLDFAAQCFDLSDGLFDITSGVLRKAWNFNDNEKLPSQEAISALLPNVGWFKVDWQRPFITLPAGMQIDFGGIGKEYAVDRTVALIKKQISEPVLVNFGGDIHASASPGTSESWKIGIEHTAGHGTKVQTVRLKRGAITTSGDTYRSIVHNGIRYGHILNPQTGWPAPGAPHSVSVLGNSCLEAGILSTLAMLQGDNAEQFLEQQHVKFWCQR